jgi:UDP-glucose 4-epimerase
MKILLTGGAGHIGSIVANHICVDNEVVIYDDLSEGFKELINPSARFIQGSIMDINALNRIFQNNKFDVVIHLAAKIVISESMVKPDLYMGVNTKGTINVLNAMKKYHCNNIIFASTAAVYGEIKQEIVDEDSPKNPCNPYGASKLAAEKEIVVSGLNYYILRFFNVAGASNDFKYGTRRIKPTLLVPLVNQRLSHGLIPIIYGVNYKTKDGSALRDYISVEDIARMIDLCLKKITNNEQQSNIFNLGNSKGYTVMEVIKQACKINQKPFVFDKQQPRPGDPSKLLASIEKAKKIMKWSPKDTLYDMIYTDYEFRKRNNLK